MLQLKNSNTLYSYGMMLATTAPSSLQFLQNYLIANGHYSVEISSVLIHFGSITV